MSGLRPKDSREYTIDERGSVRIPREVLERAGLEPKMRVTFEVKGTTIVVAKSVREANPLDGDLAKRVDLDAFAKIREQQAAERASAAALFEKGLAEADLNDAEPPDHPFRRD